MGAEFDLDSVFDDDYLYFYAERTGDARSDAEAEVVARLLAGAPGERVLDAPCGHGRIAVRLAEAGFDVTGIDRSARFLELAGAAASERGVDIDLQLGDVTDLPFEGASFDAVVNWFSSFGYHDDDTERATLRSIRRVLRPGGLLLLETMNRDWLLQLQSGRPAPLVHHVTRGDDLLVDATHLDRFGSRSHTERTMVRDGRVRRTGFTMRLHTATELAEWLKSAGFGSVEFYDGRGQLFTWQAQRLLAVAVA